VGKVKANIVALSKKNMGITRSTVSNNQSSFKAAKRLEANEAAEYWARWNRSMEEWMKEQERRFPT
jgi:hypothetical protein